MEGRTLPPVVGASGRRSSKGLRVKRSLISRFSILLLTVLFLSSPAAAAGGRAPWPGGSGLFSAFWDLLTALAAPLGSGMDPNGNPNDSGSGMDPDGLTATVCQGESGSIMDPDGCPASSDLGSIMDPDGRQ